MSTLLRLATAGSVDDGKSTLVGRLLHDTKSILADQLDAVERVSRERGLETADLALLTDGLRAEREQGITIDVAYRYFATPKRSFVLADCPGHVQYTRNTVTGSSTADVIVLLVDARHGVVEQTRRHLAVASLLRVPHVIIAVNKIDLVGFAEDAFRSVETQVRKVIDELGIPGVTVIPVSALNGDNIAENSAETPWYSGPNLLELLETLPAGEDPEGQPFRLPVQYVLRPQAAAVDPKFVEYRGYAGQIASGVVSVGDQISVLPSGRTATITGIDTADGELTEAFAGQSVSVRLSDDIDLSRGDLIAGAEGAPIPTREVEALVCWLHDRPLRPGDKVLLKHTTRTVRAIVRELDSRLDLDTLTGVPAQQLDLNDIGRVQLRLADEISAETYAESRQTGSFLLIDAQTGHTLAAGMIRNTVPEDLSATDWVI
ncbi:MAG: GTP-binding protein [Propionibacteriaceae bacterium]|nr:GTP-binding protein [Propionibacteriaceae bacterium]